MDYRIYTKKYRAYKKKMAHRVYTNKKTVYRVYTQKNIEHRVYTTKGTRLMGAFVRENVCWWMCRN